MSKFYIFVIIGVLFMNQSPIYSQDKNKKWDLNQLMDTCVMLYQPQGTNEGKVGTGTVIKHEDRYFLLTASHISEFLKDNSVIGFHFPGDKLEKYLLKDLMKNDTLDWKHHKEADIALAELESSNPGIKKYISEHSFPISQILGTKGMGSMEEELKYFGFPLIDLKGEHFSPLVFSANRSSGLLTQPRGDNKVMCNFFYLNSPSIQGCSGSGVFYGVKKTISFGDKTMLIGIIHGTFKDDTGGKMAAVTPSYYINDILNQFYSKKKND